DVGAAAKKDILQVRADRLNAEVSRLSAENQSSITEASLKATIGFEEKEELGNLVAEAEPSSFPEPESLEEAIKSGLAQRPDLVALRKRRDAQQYFVRTAEREATYTWTLDATLSRSFSEEVSDFRGLTFLVSLPLFDGHRSKEAARQQRLALMAQDAELVQAEREARADIESAHALLRQDIRRVAAAKLAKEAAQLNYDAALESQRLGAEGTDIITVLTAQVSLVTAESNYVEALYDYFISDVRLKLVTGRTMPGETS
ncbi:MAG TPA: TolC family protein, partial [Fimbriimonadaceae bacterium]|nr:TolC family protein [Fimbriimonadaceae bacterium]